MERSGEKPIRFCEPIDHKAETQLREILDIFDLINRANEQKPYVRQLSILDLHAIVFDTTGSNIGKKAGLAG